MIAVILYVTVPGTSSLNTCIHGYYKGVAFEM